MSERPNILWIVFDTARADALEPYGATSGASPVVADLARRGEVLPDVYSTACWTVPAHASMFAGGLPRQLGFAEQAGLTPPTTGPIVESLRDRLLAEVLRRSGYATSGISTNAWISRTSGFASGFERFVDVHGTRQLKMVRSSLVDRITWIVDAVRASADDGARSAGARLRAWIGEGVRRPFFWFVNLIECHSPYLPPKPFAEVPLPGRIRAAREARAHLTMGALWRACVTRSVPSAEALERMRAGYRGAIRYMDDWLGRLLQHMDGVGLLDDTLVVVSSDHGENFGEGGLTGHGFSLDERLIRTPVVASGPGAEHLRGTRSFVELPRRISEIAEADHPYDPADVPPLPVAQFDPPAPPRGDPRTERAVELWDLDDAAAERLTTSMTAAIDGPLKLVRREGKETFYDLETDPLETSAVAPDRLDPAAVARLHAALEHPAVVASEARLDRRAALTEGLSDEEAVEIEERLRMLGYL